MTFKLLTSYSKRLELIDLSGFSSWFSGVCFATISLLVFLQVCFLFIYFHLMCVLALNVLQYVHDLYLK